MSMGGEQISLRRRNGKQHACEPCRLRKIACDHTIPVCRRCERRGVPESCIYHSAPLNQQRRGRHSSTGPASPNNPGIDSGTRPTGQPNTNSSRSTPQRHPLNATTITGRKERRLFEGRDVFLGPTSFSAVFLENQNEFGESTGRPVSNTGLAPEREHEFASEIEPKLLDRCVEVLRHIPPRNIATRLFLRHINPNDGWIRVAALTVCESLWPTYGDKLNHSSGDTALKEVASRILRNTFATFNDEEDNADRWLDSFLGHNLRLESLGIVFTYWTFGALSLPLNDPMLVIDERIRLDREAVAADLKRCCTACLDMAQVSSSGNSLLAYLVYKDLVLNSILHGEASPIVSNQHGQLAALTLSLGLHRLGDSDSRVYSASLEARRRTYAAIYNHDKVIATFTGRPPLLNKRYSSTILPLDVSDEALLEGGNRLAAEIASIDENGFNTSGQMYSTTILRARVKFARLRDSILELVLSVASGDLTTPASELKRLTQAAYSELSTDIRYAAGDVANLSLTVQTLYARLLVHLEYLQNLFLLERIRAKETGSISQAVIAISSEMLELTLLWWKHQDRFCGVHGDFEWLIVSFSAPAAGILCVELIKHSRSQSNPNRATVEPVPPVTTIQYSKTIQHLSLLVGFIDCVLVTGSQSSDILSRMRAIVANVLDQILDPKFLCGGNVPESPDEILGNGDSVDGIPHCATPPPVAEFGQFDFGFLDVYDWLDDQVFV